MKADMGRARWARQSRRAVTAAAAAGLQAFMGVPGGGSRVTESAALRERQDAYKILLAEPITPANTLRFDMGAGTVSRFVSARILGIPDDSLPDALAVFPFHGRVCGGG